MRGMFLDFASDASIGVAVAEYVSLYEPEGDWVKYADAHESVATLIESGKGIPREATLTYLTRVYGAPAFISPSQRRWFFATHPEYRREPKKGKPAGERWRDIMEAARTALQFNPNMTGDELVVAINNAVEPELSEPEEGRVEKLVGPERMHRLVAPPEEIPVEERTPEVKELIEREWERIQEEREKEKEEEKAVPKKAPKPTSTKGMVPAFIQPGIPHMGRKYYRDKTEYFESEFPEIADGDHWRAFLEAVALVRGGTGESEVKSTISETYPEVDTKAVLEAVGRFIKEGAKNAYVDGRMLSEKLVREGSTSEFLAATYSDLQWAGVNSEFLYGFRAGLNKF